VIKYLSGRGDGANMQQAHRFVECLKTLFKKPKDGDAGKAERQKINDYAMRFRFTGYKIYTVAWKDNTNSTELVRDYLSTRVGNSEFLKHISQKSLVHAAKIFAALKPVKSFKLESVAALCK